MSDEAGFLKAIADRPGERATRLAYADWLEENGRPQEAEFLKVQFQIEEMNTRLIELGGQLDAKWLTAIGNVRTESLQFTLRTRRVLTLCELRQWDFYASLLEDRSMIEEVQRIVAEEESRQGQRPYLIQHIEQERPSSIKPLEMLPTDGLWEFLPTSESLGVTLPTIVCVGRFQSFQSARTPNQNASELTIIWFQDEYAFPIDPGVREQIRALDWNQHAHDFSW